MTMADWVAKLDSFLQFNERNVLTHAGKVSRELAQAHAEAQFDAFDAERKRLAATSASSDFDRVVEKAKQLEDKSGTKARRAGNEDKGKPR